MTWIDDSAEGRELFQSDYLLNSANNNWMEINRNHYSSRANEGIIIGHYHDPYYLGRSNQYNYYYDFGDESTVNLLQVDRNGSISREIPVGDYANESVILGFNPLNYNIYCFDLRFKLLSMDPPPESPDSIRNAVYIYDANTLVLTNTVYLGMGDKYLAKEFDNADYADDYLVYYFAKGDGYQRFDPAYLLIFDTRTNEATWLRVGWR
jgi:hypothetical protein